VSNEFYDTHLRSMFFSFLTEAENVEHTRPLTHLAVAVDQKEPLTPNDLLKGVANQSDVPGINGQEPEKCSSSKQWCMARLMKDPRDECTSICPERNGAGALNRCTPEMWCSYAIQLCHAGRGERVSWKKSMLESVEYPDVQVCALLIITEPES